MSFVRYCEAKLGETKTSRLTRLTVPSNEDPQSLTLRQTKTGGSVTKRHGDVGGGYGNGVAKHPRQIKASPANAGR